MIRISPGVPLVEVERSGVVESLHTGHLIVLAPDGTVRFSAGDPSQPIFARSSLKPLQAVGLLRAGAHLDSAERALAAASHSGGRIHRDLIAAELAGAGLTPEDLDCPPALPLGLAEQHEYLAAGSAPSRLAMNCSGQHAAMLLACLANEGWSIGEYLSPAHPLQRQLALTVAELAGEPIAATGVDGCGAPVFAISLLGLARAFSRIGCAAGGAEHSIAEAMRAHPELVAGPQRIATRLMQGIPGLIAKDGAEGVFAGALPDGGAFAGKIDDGAARAADRLAVRALALLGVTAPVLEDLAEQPVLGGGVSVGAVRPVL
ncbi:MAG: asparaginase [Frankiales bacterium]|nr:asparaginase [Frankiales bacterium]